MRRARILASISHAFICFVLLSTTCCRKTHVPALNSSLPPAPTQTASAQAPFAPQPATQSAPVNSTQPAPPEEEKPLPKWMKVDLLVRGRLERDMGFKTTKGNDDTDYMHRFRMGLRLEGRSWLHFYVQAQDTEVAGFSRGTPPASITDPWDMHQAYVEIGNTEKGPWAARIGRQQLTFGENRLVGFSEWTNSGRTFDAARLTYSRTGVRVDAFAAALVSQLNPRFDHPQLKNGFYGVYASFDRLIRKAVVEPYVLYKVNSGVHGEIGSTGTENLYTLGIRSAGVLVGRTTYSIETALQTGNYAADRIRAWAGHWNVGIPLPARTWSPRWLLEFNHASGDDGLKDGRHGTFDSLFPNSHDKYGLMDRFAWRNMNETMTGVEARPGAGWRIKTAIEYFWLANKADAVYTTNGVVVQTRNPTGRRLGPELDLQASKTFSRHIDIGFGYGHLWAGAYLLEATKYTGSSYPYFTWTYRM